MDVEGKKPRKRKQWKRPVRWLGRSDWEVVCLPPVQPEDGWREYFLGELPDGKAAA